MDAKIKHHGLRLLKRAGEAVGAALMSNPPSVAPAGPAPKAPQPQKLLKPTSGINPAIVRPPVPPLKLQGIPPLPGM